jgi:hypothetical protein
VAEKSGVNPNTVELVIKKNQERIGEIETYRSGKRTLSLLSPSQQDIIGELIDANVRIRRLKLAQSALNKAS